MYFFFRSVRENVVSAGFKTATRKKHFFKINKLWAHLAMADPSFRRVLGQHVESEAQQQSLLGLVTPDHPDFRQALDGRIMPRSHGYAVAHCNDERLAGGAAMFRSARGEKNNFSNDALCVTLIQHRLPFGFMFFLITIAIIACVFHRALAAAAFRFRDT